MSNAASETEKSGAGEDQAMSALFASMVAQHTSVALMFLGQQPNPQTGETTQDLEHARYFIDLLEMIAVKTQGNLDKREDALLKQSLTHVRLSFVEAVKNPPKSAPPAPTPTLPATPASPPTDEQETPVNEPALPGENAAEIESRKKFSKKY